MVEFYNENRIKKSKKPHICHICGMEIPAGDSYYRESGLYEGEFFDRCTCDVCFSIREEYMTKNSWFDSEYDEWAIEDHARENFCAEHCSEFEECGHQWSLRCGKLRSAYAEKKKEEEAK